jgi:hypothetical protein
MKEFNAEYIELTTKADKGPLTYEELNRLNEIHVSMIRKCYESFIRNEEGKNQVKEALIFLAQSWREIDNLNQAYANFLEGMGLTNEFLDYFLVSNGGKNIISNLVN